MLNLNLGAGSNRKQDYISVDYYTDADQKVDLTKSWPWAEVDNIYASHFIEHLDRHEFIHFVHEVKRVLKIGGTLEIRCPDLSILCRKFLYDPSDMFTMMQLYGLQTNPGEYHKNGFTEELLKEWFKDYKAEVLDPSTDTELHMRFTRVS